MNLFLRFEGFPRIGLGAIYKKEQIRRFLDREFGLEAVALVSRETAGCLDGLYCGPRQVLESPLYSAEEVGEVAGLIDAGSGARCITGLINAPSEYMSGLQQLMSALAIEDQPTPALDAWGVLNHAPVVDWHGEYGAVENRFLGPGYTLLREAVLAMQARPVVGEGIVITMGGANYTGSTVRIAGALKRTEIPVKVVMGPSFGHETELREVVGGAAQMEIFRNPPDFIEMLAGARLVVSQGGSTLYELAYLGTPPVVLGEDPHEITLGRAMQELGFARCLGDGMACGEEEMVHEIASLYRDETQIQQMRATGFQLGVGAGWTRFREVVVLLMQDEMKASRV